MQKKYIEGGEDVVPKQQKEVAMRNAERKLVKKLWNTLLMYGNGTLWVVFAMLVFFEKHRMVVSTRDWHGQYVGESYLVASNFSMTLYGINMVLLLLLILKSASLLYHKQFKQTMIYFVNILLGLAWIGWYEIVCIKEPYFF